MNHQTACIWSIAPIPNHLAARESFLRGNQQRDRQWKLRTFDSHPTSRHGEVLPVVGLLVSPSSMLSGFTWEAYPYLDGRRRKAPNCNPELVQRLGGENCGIVCQEADVSDGVLHLASPFRPAFVEKN